MQNDHIQGHYFFLSPVYSLVDIHALTDEQKWVMNLILNQHASRQTVLSPWKSQFDSLLSMEALYTCITRTCLSIPWEKGMSGGNPYYLCAQDFRFIEETIQEKARMDRAYDTYSILEEAYQLKLARIEKAVQLLHLFRADQLASQLQHSTVQKPTRKALKFVQRNH